MSKTILAEQYTRDSNGWILFPDDVAYRKSIFPEEVNRHPAKANLHMVREIIEFVSEPEETLMDIMAGSGSILIGLKMGRKVVAIEIDNSFFQLIEEGLIYLSGEATLLHGPCQTFLPLPVDHIIFSPPYAQIMKSKGKDKLTVEKTPYAMDSYTQGVLNIGQVNEFLYHHMMAEIYKLCWQSLHSGSTLTVIIKDHIRGGTAKNLYKDGQRIFLSTPTINNCQEIGFKLKDWYKWPTLGSVYTRIYRSQGRPTVDDEDILIFSKP